MYVHTHPDQCEAPKAQGAISAPAFFVARDEEDYVEKDGVTRIVALTDVGRNGDG